MTKSRKDKNGRVLQKGESQRSQDGRYVYTYMNPLGKRSYLYGTTLQELREKEEKVFRDQLDRIDLYASGKVDLNYVVDRYLATRKNLASSTFANYRYMCDKFIKDSLGRRKVSELKYSDILFFYLEQVEKGIQIKTLETLHCVIHPALSMAVRDDIIRKNPSDGIISEVKKMRKPLVKRKKALTYEQQTRFMNYVKVHPLYDYWYPLFTVLLETGCRIGEICGLRWEDVNFEECYIDVNHSMTLFRRGKEAPFTYEFRYEPTKTAAGIRKIPMTRNVYKVLMDLYGEQRKKGFSDLTVDGHTNFVFINNVGKLYKHTAIDHAIKRIVRRYNEEESANASLECRKPILLPEFSCHTFRHTFCTRLCERITNIKAIQAIMGHVDIRTTMDIYAEVTEMKKKEVMEEIADIFN